MEPEKPAPRPASAAEPIAVIGMACRFPGAPDIPSFWRLLETGGNAVTEGVPGSGVGRVGELLPESAAGNTACRFGAFVPDIDLFDNRFFRISPVEAELLDPQQRMMLEVSWQALEDAGIAPDRLKGSRTGVYAGISNDEYRMLVVDGEKPAEAAGCLYALSGTNLNGAAGRVSFVLGVMGPAKAVDAACASSLVSVHDAVADLQAGKADLALAGGVQAILNGRIYELRADSMMLSPDGQCKAFDASANGYVRGEGCGVVVLKRLREAEADGDPIWGVIHGAAVNHGGASVGLTVPNEPALVRVMDEALSDAGVAPAEVDYIEAHGTGTTVGDPIEINAVAAVYARERQAEHPLLVGSVKTNLGHLESAAGIAGLIKAVLVVQRGVIPRHLHFNDPNPSLDWERLPIRVTSEMTDWPRRNGRPRFAGVNSFGISGTNSHLIVGEYPGAGDRPQPGSPLAGSARPVTVGDLPQPREGLRTRRTRVLPISAKTAGALGELTGRYLEWLDQLGDGDAADNRLADMAWTAGTGRSHFDHRAALVFADAASLGEQLRALADAGGGVEPGARARVAFAYTGQGSQWAGMGEALYEHEPVVRSVLDRCEAAFREARGGSLLDVMFGRDPGDADLGDTAWEQPALYALECALTALWASVGIRPAVVMGHSVGEIAAARTAGVFSLETGMRFAAARGTLLSGTAPGAMAAAFAPAERVAAAVAGWNAASSEPPVNISADNGAHQVVSGPESGIEGVSKRLQEDGVRVRRLNTTRAFHSALVEPALPELAAVLDDAEIASPTVTLVSNLTGQPVGPGDALDGAYWRRHAREPVAFAQGVSALAGLGVDLVVEIGPRPVLAPMVMSAWPASAAAQAPAVIASQRAPSGDEAAAGHAHFVKGVAEAYEAGLQVRFEGLFTGEERRRLSVPGYPFQRERYWLKAPKRRRQAAGNPLLGVRHESARGEITFETEVFPSEPAWLNDHRVFERLIAPGALSGAMAMAASLAEGGGPVALEDMQLHNPLVFPESKADGGADEAGRKLQVALDPPEAGTPRRVQVFSKGSEGEWTLHLEGRISPNPGPPEAGGRADLEALKTALAPGDVGAYYRARSATGIDLGPSFRTLERVWCRPGEALAEVSFPEGLGRNELEIHPLVLDGCFQTVGVARLAGGADEATYLPFGWDRVWLTGRLPDRVICHVRMNEAAPDSATDAAEPPEVLSGEIRIYDPDGVLLGGLSGYAVKRATRQALLSAVEGVDELLYEVVWRDRALPPGISPADFLPSPETVAAGQQLLSGYLTAEGVAPRDRNGLLEDLERWSRSRALATLEELGFRREAGAAVDPEALREELNVLPEHRRLFRRLLEMLAKSGVLAEAGDGFTVAVGSGDPLPEHLPRDLDAFADRMVARYSHGVTEVGLFRRCGGALGEALRGAADPLTLLFSSGDPTPADLYLKAPVARAANRMLRDAVRALLAGNPEGRRLRVVEVGAGTGSATTYILPELPEGQFLYTYTDISAGFFAEAESRFGDAGGCIEYRPLDVEKDPIAQGFERHGYDLLIASNVLHATRYLPETLRHCLDLLAPSGTLVALENLSGLGWMDLTFGQLDGWWRFADDYRPHHALASPAVWRQALGDAGFTGAEVLGVDESDASATPDKGVIVAQGPSEVKEPRGSWVLTGDPDGLGGALAADLAARNQTVVFANSAAPGDDAPPDGPGVFSAAVEPERRESWGSLIGKLPDDAPFSGAVHLASLEGRGTAATTAEVAEDVRRATASALALTQAVADADLTPAKGMWFITRGAQVLERETGGEIAGATLWGFGKAVVREAPHLQARMLDLDPAPLAPGPDLPNELLYPDPENHLAYRRGARRVARLVRAGAEVERLTLPEDPEWALAPDPEGIFEKPYVQPLPAPPLAPREVRVGVEAAGLNFWDVFRSLGFIPEGNLGREMCGRILEVGSEVSRVSVGDPVVGLGFGAFAAAMVTHEELVAPAPPGFSVTGLATVPSAFVSAALSFEFTGLEPGERVLIHAGAGGVGLAAIQWVQAAGAEVFATASAPKQAYLRSLGVEHVFDSRQTAFGNEIREATGGAGVDVVLNSLTGEGFIEASLSCLRRGGRFVEMARRDILSEEEMAAVRPDVPYHILELDVLKKTDPEKVGKVFRDVMARVAAGELQPIVHSRWPLAEAGAALGFMRSARHLGKIVVTAPPLRQGRLRPDRTYLVTGGLGGIGCAVAEWLADRGAGTIVLNGRREPDPAAEEIIGALRERGVQVEVELADVSDSEAVDRMLARLDRDLPPLGGVIHSVGVLSDAALTNQNWESFETVLSPKIRGAWHLHRATLDRDLDLFILFSSRVGVMGNPGQANHAAANAFLDQLAGHRRALGLAGQAIAWGAWSEIGEAAEQRGRIERQRAALGGRWFTPEQGIRALDRLVRQDVTHSVVMAMDWGVFEEAVQDRPPLVEDLLSSASEPEDESSSSSEDVLTRLRGPLGRERQDLLVTFLQGEVQAVLRLSSAPSPTVGFFDLGMDSLMAVEFRNRLNRAFSGVYTAPNTVVFDYPDIARLAAHLDEELGEVSEAPAAAPEPESRSAPFAVSVPAPVPAAPQEVAAAADGIAIVGMACRFPGAPDLETFWRQLEAGVEAVFDGRPDGGSWTGVAGDPAGADDGTRRGGFIEGVDRFDARFFGITPIGAWTMDPQHRLLLETSWRALEDAGLDPEKLRDSNTGVYAGVASSEYRDLMLAAGQNVSYLGTAASMAVGTVSFRLGLTGPAMAVELNCASALVAVHHAVTALHTGEVDLALAGGVNAILSPGKTSEMVALSMLSPTGRCRAFDAGADGFPRGEGCGMVALKRLGEAEADGDRIWGVIRGSAVNQSGASAGPTVPNGVAQQAVMEAALARAGITPAEVDYLEAHGNGSVMGDPIELQAAAAVYGQGRASDRPLLIGSVKTNVGHLETAAGVAALIKAALAVNHGVIPPHLHFENPTPVVDWDRLPVRVTAETTAWPAHPDRPARAAVSAFGVSGANAHLVMEGGETPNGTPAGGGVPVAVAMPETLAGLEPAADVPGAREVRFLPLSAKSEAGLGELARSCLDWLDEHAGEISSGNGADPLLADLAWTAGVGRSHFDVRRGVVFRSAETLREGLASLAGPDGVRATESAPQAPRKIAFAYSGEAGPWLPATEPLYGSEPVFRAVLDRCEEVFREERGTSLLDALFESEPARLGSPEWSGPALYAVQCALTALWSSIGIGPQAANGQDIGALAAAQATGALDLEDGLRRAVLGEAPSSAGSANPDFLGGSEFVMEIGPGAAGGFVAAVAEAYESGLEINFEGLFAGETRRRISLPGYPFERRRYWIPASRSRVMKSG